MAVVTSLLDDSTQIINLNETICHGKYAPRLLERNNSNCYLLPSIYSKNNALSRQIEIIPLFVWACRDAMFKIGGRYEKDHYLAIVFKCIRSILNNHGGNQRETLIHCHKKSLKKPHEPPIGTLPNGYIRLSPVPRIGVPRDWRAPPGRVQTVY